MLQLEAMAQVEAVGIAQAQGRHPHRQALPVSLVQHLGHHPAAHAQALGRRGDVQVVQHQVGRARLQLGQQHHEAHPLAAQQHMAGVGRLEGPAQALAGACLDAIAANRLPEDVMGDPEEPEFLAPSDALLEHRAAAQFCCSLHLLAVHKK